MRLWIASTLVLLFSFPSFGQDHVGERPHLAQTFMGLSTTTYKAEQADNYLSYNIELGYHPLKNARLGLQYRFSLHDFTGISHLPFNSTISRYSTHEFAPFVEYIHQWRFKIKPTARLELGYGRIVESKQAWSTERLDPEIRPYFFTGGIWLGARRKLGNLLNVNFQLGMRKFIYNGRPLYGLPGYRNRPFFISAQLGVDFFIFRKRR